MKLVLAAMTTVALLATPALAQRNDDSQAQPAGVAQLPDVQQEDAKTPDAKPPDAKPQDNPPPRTHTGWSTLFKDTAQDFVAFPKRRSTWTLLAIGGAAALAAHPGDGYVERHIVGNTTASRVFAVGKWAGSSEAEVGTAVGLWLVGRYIVAPAADEPQTNKYSELGFDLIRAEIVSQALTHAVKYSVRRDRPTGECCSFPSGHAATAFAMASVLERHFGYRASLPAIAGAAYVAASRLVDNRHFLSDVMFGAGIGTASGWTVVGTRGRSHYAILPVPVHDGMMLTLTRLPA